jgi:hypothetical protein
MSCVRCNIILYIRTNEKLPFEFVNKTNDIILILMMIWKKNKNIIMNKVIWQCTCAFNIVYILRSRSSHTKLVYETPLFVGQGTSSGFELVTS